MHRQLFLSDLLASMSLLRSLVMQHVLAHVHCWLSFVNRCLLTSMPFYRELRSKKRRVIGSRSKDREKRWISRECVWRRGSINSCLWNRLRAAGDNKADLDFNAVQRGDPEMAQKALIPSSPPIPHLDNVFPSLWLFFLKLIDVNPHLTAVC